MIENPIFPPDLDDVLIELKREIFATINCIQVGKIESYDTAEQTAEIELQFRRRVDKTKIEKYPLLVDCPVFVLQGGESYIDMPIKQGDYCLVLFNDRDIDDWWATANLKEPRSFRKHSLSDGFALVGINPKTSVRDLDGDKMRIIAGSYDLDIKSNGQTVFNDGTDFMVRYNELETAFNQLKQDFDDFVSLTYGLHTHTFDYNAGPTAASGTTAATLSTGSPSTADITPAKIDDINVPGVGE